MIFSLTDYRRYVRLSGRYARYYRNFMGGAFQGVIPTGVVETMKPGDVLFVQTLGSSVSWLIMYLSSSEVSHFAYYIGDGKIAHATTNAGCVIEPIDSLFDRDTRLLVAQQDLTESKRMELVESIHRYLGASYGWRSVFHKAYQILSGRDWDHFRWKFAADIIFTILILDIPLALILHRPVISWIVPFYLMLIGFNVLRWKMRPPGLDVISVKPNHVVQVFLSSGATLVYDKDFMSKQIKDEIDMLRDYARRRSGVD